MIWKAKLKLLLSLICSGWYSTLSQVLIPQVQRREHYSLSTHRAVSHTVPTKDKKYWLPPKEPLEDFLTSPSVVKNSASSPSTASYSRSPSREQTIPVFFSVTFSLCD